MVAIGRGDGCGTCDVVLCARCLNGTARCPSCQRAFSETRDAAPRAERRGGDARIDTGRQETLAVAASLMLAAPIFMLMGKPTAFGMAVSCSFLALIIVQLVRGRGWARWLLVAVSGAYAVSSAHAAFSAASGRGMPSWVAIALAAVFAVNALVLALRRPVALYLRTQRLRHP